MTAQALPHDLHAERAVLGRMLVRPDAIPDICGLIGAEDFYLPMHATVFLTLVDGWQHGEPLDSVALSVAAVDGADPAWIAQTLCEAPAGHARLVRELQGRRIRRGILTAAAEATIAARNMMLDPGQALEEAQAALNAVDVPVEDVRDLWMLDDFIDRDAASEPWVIPGLFRTSWRALLVASEGKGKSELSRQIALAAAAGVHPLFGSKIPPIRTLIVDLENPVDSLVRSGRRLRRQAQQSGDYDRDRCHVWHRPAGIDIRRRSDRAQLEGVVARCRPQFVALGPLYKAYTTRAREQDEQAAGEAQQVLDDLRTRYGFALLLEHHAPKPQGGHREILPYGSSLWLRWPEMGFKLTPTDGRGESTLDVGKWREPRMPHAWPNRITRGQGWPWVGEWDRPYADAMADVVGATPLAGF